MSAEEQYEKTLSSRLLLHAYSLSFNFKGVDYTIESTIDVKNEFYALMKG